MTRPSPSFVIIHGFGSFWRVTATPHAGHTIEYMDSDRSSFTTSAPALTWAISDPDLASEEQLEIRCYELFKQPVDAFAEGDCRG